MNDTISNARLRTCLATDEIEAASGPGARPVAIRLLAGVVLWCVAGCVAQPLRVGMPTMAAHPNPSPDGAYTVSWTPIGGASKYRLEENGVPVYEGSRPWHRAEDKPAGTYAYALSYCVTVFGIEACNLQPAVENVTVEVTER